MSLSPIFVKLDSANPLSFKAKAADLCLYPLRKAFGYQIGKFPQDGSILPTIVKTNNLWLSVACAFIALTVLLPFTLIGIACAYNSPEHFRVVTNLSHPEPCKYLEEFIPLVRDPTNQDNRSLTLALLNNLHISERMKLLMVCRATYQLSTSILFTGRLLEASVLNAWVPSDVQREFLFFFQAQAITRESGEFLGRYCPVKAAQVLFPLRFDIPDFLDGMISEITYQWLHQKRGNSRNSPLDSLFAVIGWFFNDQKLNLPTRNTLRRQIEILDPSNAREKLQDLSLTKGKEQKLSTFIQYFLSDKAKEKEVKARTDDESLDQIRGAENAVLQLRLHRVVSIITSNPPRRLQQVIDIVSELTWSDKLLLNRTCRDAYSRSTTDSVVAHMALATLEKYATLDKEQFAKKMEKLHISGDIHRPEYDLRFSLCGEFVGRHCSLKVVDLWKNTAELLAESLGHRIKEFSQGLVRGIIEHFLVARDSEVAKAKMQAVMDFGSQLNAESIQKFLSNFAMFFGTEKWFGVHPVAPEREKGCRTDLFLPFLELALETGTLPAFQPFLHEKINQLSSAYKNELLALLQHRNTTIDAAFAPTRLPHTLINLTQQYLPLKFIP